MNHKKSQKTVPATPNKTYSLPITLDGWSEAGGRPLNWDDDDFINRAPTLSRPLNDLYEEMFPRCPMRDDILRWIKEYRVDKGGIGEESPDSSSPSAPRCEKKIYDVLDPKLQELSIGGILYSSDGYFPDPQHLIFIIRSSGMNRALPPINYCVSYKSIEKEYFKAIKNRQIVKVNKKTSTTFMKCQWFLSFAHNTAAILPAHTRDFMDQCDCEQYFAPDLDFAP